MCHVKDKKKKKKEKPLKKPQWSKLKQFEEQTLTLHLQIQSLKKNIQKNHTYMTEFLSFT